MRHLQRFPESGALARNLNRSLASLREIVGSLRGPVYCYVMDSIKFLDGRYVQTGSGPNFQGDLITLCTCKHQMRSRRSPREWPGAWIAGFSGRSTVPGQDMNCLVYLMRVAKAHLSQQDLWRALPDSVRAAKAADLHPLGDLFRPREPLGNPFDVQAYHPPRPDHSHCHDGGWLEDIRYVGRNGRRAPLLEGDQSLSFLWNRPTIGLRPPPLARDYETNRFSGVSDLVNELVEL